MKIKLISDSTCDLPEELINKYDISIIPMHVVMDGISYDDSINLDPQQIYEWSDRTGKVPTTSAPSVGEIEEILKPYVDEYNQFILFSIASGMSSSNQSMHIAVNDLRIDDRALVIDSQNLSVGIGLLLIKTAEMIADGMDIFEIESILNELIPKVRSSFIVDSLTYLSRGGRCSGLSAAAGSALRIHPVISVSDGKMIPAKKYRGKLDRIFLTYANDLEPQLKNADRSRIFVVHSGNDEGIVSKIAEELKDKYGFEEVLITRAGCVISSHCGPNALGIMFIES